MCCAQNKAFLIFTPSVTIALNQIILGQAWKAGDNVYVTPYEHNAVNRPLELVRKRYHVNLIEMPLKEDRSIDLEQVRDMFEQRPPRFVCVTAISNVTGYILPAGDIFAAAKQYDAFTLLDAAQAFGLLELRFAQLQADAIAFAGHKTLYAPFGIAGFFLRYGVELEESITGGNGVRSLSVDMPAYAPDRYEAGSMNTPAIAGLHAALQWLENRDIQTEERLLIRKTVKELHAIPGVKLYHAPTEEAQAGVVSFNLEDIDASVVGSILDRKYDIAVRAGHHCAAMIHRHLNTDINRGCVRVSVGAFNTEDDVNELIRAVSELEPDRLRNISPSEIFAIC